MLAGLRCFSGNWLHGACKPARVRAVCGREAPILVIAGANDPRVPVGEGVQIHDALEAKGVKSQLIIFPDEGHGAAKRANQVVEFGASLDFFEQTLKPKGDTHAQR